MTYIPDLPKTIDDITGLQAALDAKAAATALAAKADASALAAKADASALAAKADASALAGKADAAAVTSALANKADIAALSAKADAAALTAKADATAVTSALAAKADSTALALKADISALTAKADETTVMAGLAERSVKVATLADLKNLPVVADKVAFMIGKNNMNDNQGGFFRWDATSTDVEDTTYLNIVTSLSTGLGRWKKVFTRGRAVTGGTLVLLGGGMKIYYTSGTTDANGKITLNITEENTSTGTAIFNSIFAINADPQTLATGPATAVQSYKEALAGNLKTTTYGFYKANAFTVVLAAVITPVANIGSGTVVNFVIHGS